MSGANQEQAEFWEALAPLWLASEDHVTVISARFGAPAMELLELQPGQRVLDVGCGSGATTCALAGQVGPDGEAIGADIAPSMVAAATDRARSLGCGNARFEVADAQADELGPEAYDAVFSQFGVMFFADPAAAFANLRRSLTPGGRLAFVCWQSIFDNEWMFVPAAAAVSVTGELPPMPGPGEPGPFSLSEPGRVEAVLTEAGYTGIEVTPLNETIVLPEAGIPSMVESAQRVGAVREALRVADAETTERIVAAVSAALVERVVDGQLSLTGGVLLVRARP
ncbi:MAG TPA: methyltransferase domain-containing protein [Acidimicrobiales bacterium]